MPLKDGIKRVVPPIALDGWRAARRKYSRRPPSWEFVGYEWVDDDPGWDSAGVVEAYRQKLPRFRQAIVAPAPIGVGSEAIATEAANPYDQNVVLECAYAVSRARGPRSQLSILDWGGGFGYTSFVVRELFPDLDVDFHVRDVPRVVAAARPLVPDVVFWDSDECLDREFDLVTASSSLQYAPEWKVMLSRLGHAGRSLFLSRLPVTLTAPTFATRQRAYATSYIGWVLNRDELLEAAHAADLDFVREFHEGWSADISGAPGANEHRAFLFTRRRP
jgi:putative methyltransferase (TIGR04325 family)